MGSVFDCALQRGESVRNGCIEWLAFDEKRLPTPFHCLDEPFLQPLSTVRFVAVAPPTTRACRHAQDLRRVDQRQCPPLSPLVSFLKPHLSHLL